VKRLGTVGLVVSVLAATASFVRADDRVTRGRELVRSKDLLARKDGIRMLVDANSAASIQPLEDLIRLDQKDMDQLAKGLDKLDVEYDKALGYWNEARNSNSREFYDLAKQYLEVVKSQWELQEAQLAFLLETSVLAGQSFVRFDDPGAVTAIEAGAKSESDVFVKQWYVQGLAGAKRVASVPVLLGLLSSADPMTRAMAMRSLWYVGLDRRVFDVVSKMVTDKSWQVRVGAYLAIAHAPVDFAAPLLVDAAVRENGEPARVADSLLTSLLGLGFPDDPRQWGPWWKENGEDVLAGRDVASRPGPAAPSGDSATHDTFFGIPMESTNVLFVLDYSSSMEADLEHGDPRNREIRAQARLPATRLGVAQAEAIRAIRSLPANASVQVVVFSDKAKRYSDRAVLATPSNKTSLVGWLVAQKTGWLTNVWDGLRGAFRDILAKPSSSAFLDLPDTIIFLSDGGATRGRFQRNDALATQVAAWNYSVGAMVHAVGVGAEQDADLLRALVEPTGGVYVDIRRPTTAFRPSRPTVPKNVRCGAVPRLLAQARAALDQAADAEAKLFAVDQIFLMSGWSSEFPALTVDLLGDEEESVRNRVAARLASLPDLLPKVLEVIGPALEKGAWRELPAASGALAFLARIGPKAAPAAHSIAFLVATPESPYRTEAARLLGSLGPAAKAEIPLLESCKESADEALRKEIDAAIKKIGK
jgi:hypothetical protein